MVIGPLYDQSLIPRTGGVPYDEPYTRGPSTAIEGRGEVQIGWKGLEPDQAREWEENNSPYRNLAGNAEIADRALQCVNQHAQQYDQRTLRLQRKWQTINYLLQGNSLVNWEDPEGVHSPQLFQMVENLEARITDAVLGLSSGSADWFTVRGREPMDWRQEQVMTAYLDYILDKNRFKTKVPELVRTMLIHAFAVMHTRWRHKFDFRVEKNRRKVMTGRGPRWITNRKEVEKVVYSGPDVEAVDPFWFMCDTTETEVPKMTWIAHRSKRVYDEILAEERAGHYMNARRLEAKEPRTWGETYADWSRHTRSHTFPYDQPWAFYRPEGMPKEFYVVEWWGLFDIYNEGLTRECVITVANGDTVLEVRENPHDDKHRPYAIARCCKYPFDFHSVGPLDHCIQLSVEIDTHRALAVEGSRLSICPLIFTDQKTADMGDSIWGVQPGKVFEVPVNSIKFSEIKSPVGEMRYMEQILREDIEMTAGAPRAYMGGLSGRSTSATEYQGRIREANQRIRSYIRSFTEMCEQMLRQIHSLCGQYLSSYDRFRVLGRQGAQLQEWEEVNPEMFDPDVDFEFVAIANLHVAGMEATNLQLYLQTMAPFAEANPDLLDMPRLAQRFAKLLLGSRAEEVVRIPDDPRDLMAQEDEITIMLGGDPVPLMEGDDDEEHAEVIGRYRETEHFWKQPDHVRNLIEEHMEAHLRQADRKRRQRRAIENWIPSTPFPPAAYAGQGTPPGTMTNMERMIASPTDQTNGPVNAQQIPASGRAGGFFQTQQDVAA